LSNNFLLLLLGTFLHTKIEFLAKAYLFDGLLAKMIRHDGRTRVMKSLVLLIKYQQNTKAFSLKIIDHFAIEKVFFFFFT